MSVNVDELTAYFNVGADLIPLHPWNKQKVNKQGKVVELGKTPLEKGWRDKRKYKKEEILKYANSVNNVGYRIGDNDLVIDVDPRRYEFDDSLEELCKAIGLTCEELFSNYPTVKTGGGGYHIYMHVVSSNSKLKECLEDYPGIEFKRKGRQVVAAGSRHPSGGHYEFALESPELSEDVLDYRCPLELIKLLKRDDENLESTKVNVNEISETDLEYLLEQLPAEDFNDNDSWFPLLCASHHATNGKGVDEFIKWSTSDDRYKYDEDVIRNRWDSLGDKDVNYTINTLYKTVLSYGGDTSNINAKKEFESLATTESDNEPELFEAIELTEDVNLIVDDIVKAPEIDATTYPGVAKQLVNDITDVSKDEDVVKAIKAILQTSQIEQVKLLKQIQNKLGITKGELNVIIKQVKEKIIDDLGRILAEKTREVFFYNKKGLIFSDNGQFWAYNGKFWHAVTRQYVGKMITKLLDKLKEKIEINVKENSIVSEATSIIERITAVDKDVLRFKEKPYPVVNCKNGELWIKSDGTTELRSHRPKSFLKQLIDVDYLPGSECPLFDTTIREIFANFTDCEDLVRHFEELMGYILYPDKNPAHFWLLKGPGGDGKTTLMKILCALLGDSVMPESIMRFKEGKDNHVMFELIGKLLIYDDDLNKKTQLPDGILKKLSEDGYSTANPKGVGGFKFVRACTPVMLSNGYPITRDVSRGFRRRAMVIPFNRAFHEEGEILNLAEKITKSELSGILNRAMEGLQRVRNRGGFLPPVSAKLAKEEWFNESNVICDFVDSAIIKTDDYKDKIELGDLYNHFLDFATAYNLRFIPTKSDFKSTLIDLDFKYGKGGQNRNYFRFVKLARNDAFDDLDF